MDCNRTRTERITLRMTKQEKEFLLRQKEKSKFMAVSTHGISLRLLHAKQNVRWCFMWM